MPQENLRRKNMQRKILASFIATFCFFLSIISVNAQPSYVSDSSTTIKKQLRSSELMKSLNKEVKVEGYYYAGSIPMIIDDIERTYDNMILPKHSYIPIVGKISNDIKSGDRISLKGILRKPQQGDSKTVINESVVIQAVSVQKILSAEKVTAFDKYKDIPKIQPFPFGESPAEKIKKGIKKDSVIKQLEKISPQEAVPGRKFAVLIAGGGDYSDNHIRYWNDLLTMYQILREKGYPAQNIRVIYHDGFKPENTVDGKIKGDMPIDFEATKENIRRVFDELASTMTGRDKLFIMINNHGGGLLLKKHGYLEPGLHGGRFDEDNELTEDLISEATYREDYNNDKDKNDLLRVDESFILGPYKGQMYDDEFAEEVNKIRNYASMIIVMEQCFSGGFINDLRGPNRIIMSAAGPNQISKARWPRNGGVAKYNEFTYWFFTVLMGRTPDGDRILDREGKEVSPQEFDFNEDGKISMQEAFNWARRLHKTDDTPHYEDNNQSPALTGWVPGNDPSSEGYLGANTFIE